MHDNSMNPDNLHEWHLVLSAPWDEKEPTVDELVAELEQALRHTRTLRGINDGWEEKRRAHIRRTYG